MTNEQDMTLVFKDQAGEYYLLPQATLEQGRVPEEHKAEIEHLIAEQQDAQGYSMDARGGGSGPPPWGDPVGAYYYFYWKLGYTAPPLW